jgi:hypothetical protein
MLNGEPNDLLASQSDSAGLEPTVVVRPCLMGPRYREPPLGALISNIYEWHVSSTLMPALKRRKCYTTLRQASSAFQLDAAALQRSSILHFIRNFELLNTHCEAVYLHRCTGICAMLRARKSGSTANVLVLWSACSAVDDQNRAVAKPAAPGARATKRPPAKNSATDHANPVPRIRGW